MPISHFRLNKKERPLSSLFLTISDIFLQIGTFKLFRSINGKALRHQPCPLTLHALNLRLLAECSKCVVLVQMSVEWTGGCVAQSGQSGQPLTNTTAAVKQQRFNLSSLHLCCGQLHHDTVLHCETLSRLQYTHMLQTHLIFNQTEACVHTSLWLLHWELFTCTLWSQFFALCWVTCVQLHCTICKQSLQR